MSWSSVKSSKLINSFRVVRGPFYILQYLKLLVSAKASLFVVIFYYSPRFYSFLLDKLKPGSQSILFSSCVRWSLKRYFLLLDVMSWWSTQSRKLFNSFCIIREPFYILICSNLLVSPQVRLPSVAQIGDPFWPESESNLFSSPFWAELLLSARRVGGRFSTANNLIFFNVFGGHSDGTFSC